MKIQSFRGRIKSCPPRKAIPDGSSETRLGEIYCINTFHRQKGNGTNDREQECRRRLSVEQPLVENLLILDLGSGASHLCLSFSSCVLSRPRLHSTSQSSPVPCPRSQCRSKAQMFDTRGPRAFITLLPQPLHLFGRDVQISGVAKCSCLLQMQSSWWVVSLLGLQNRLELRR